MPFDLYPYQHTGADWLAARKRALLFDDQGVGKTPTAIGATDRLKANRNLVLCPGIVLFNWAREVKRFSTRDQRVQVITHGEQDIDPEANWVVCTHSRILAPGLFRKLYGEKWATLIVDEGQQFRNYMAKRTQALYGMPGFEQRRIPRLIDRAVYVWILTGTPMMNHVGDLYPHLYGLFPERIKNEIGKPMSPEAFLEKYAVTKPTRYGFSVHGNRDVDGMRQVLDGIYLRRMKDEVLPDLPPIDFHLLTLPAPAKFPWDFAELEGKLRDSVVRKIAADLESLDEDEDAVDAALAAFRRHEDFSRYRRLCGLLKVRPTMELVFEEMFPFGARTEVVARHDAKLQKFVIFAHHGEVLDGLEAKCWEVLVDGCVRIDGKVSAKQRDHRIQRFQSDPSVAIALCQIEAAGTGATLTAANEVIFVEQSFTPSKNTQAADRVHRVGQDRPVRVRMINLADTADELVVEILRRKMKMIRETIK